jgi:hypothetical protein
MEWHKRREPVLTYLVGRAVAEDRGYPTGKTVV